MRKIKPTDIAGFLPEHLGAETPGFALAVIDGEKVQTLCQGLAVMEHGIPITEETAFRIASVTKHFLGLVTLIYHDKGEVDLDAPLGRYLRELSGIQAKVTLRQALQNCSGIRDHLELATMAGGNVDQPVSVAQSLELIARQSETNFPPGSDFLYSNANFLLVTLALERATGCDLRALLKSHLFEPNGMASTRYEPGHRSIIPQMAAGYIAADKGFEKAVFAQELTGEGAMVSTLADLIRWYQYLRADPDGLVARLSEPTLFTGGATGHYAIGFFTRPFHGTPSRGHNGLWPGYRTDLVRFDDLDLGLICLSNLNTIDPTGITRNLVKALVPEKLDLAEAKAAVEPFKKLTSSGTFLNEESLEVARFSAEDGKLMVDFGGWPAQVHITGPTQAIFAIPGDYQALDWSELDQGRMHLTRMNGATLTLTEASRFAQPLEADRYTGLYSCAELHSTLKIEQTGEALRAWLRGSFAHRPAWQVTLLTRDVLVLGDDTGPWPRRLSVKREGNGLRVSGFRVKNMGFVPDNTDQTGGAET